MLLQTYGSRREVVERSVDWREAKRTATRRETGEKPREWRWTERFSRDHVNDIDRSHQWGS